MTLTWPPNALKMTLKCSQDDPEMILKTWSPNHAKHHWVLALYLLTFVFAECVRKIPYAQIFYFNKQKRPRAPEGRAGISYRHGFLLKNQLNYKSVVKIEWDMIRYSSKMRQILWEVRTNMKKHACDEFPWRSQNDPKVIPKWPSDDLKMAPKRSQNDFNMTLTWPQHHPQMLPT